MKNTLCGYVAGAVLALLSTSASAETLVWLSARPADGAIVTTVKELAAEYAKDHPGFELDVQVTADRASYLTKLRTLVASGDVPAFFDTDADPYAQQLADAGLLVDMGAFLQEKGLLEKFYEPALKYQQFQDGSLYLLPLEYHLLGYAYRRLTGWPASALREHGSYREEDLPRLLGDLAPHVVWFPGSCPETYSYTLSACMELGIPVVAPAIGAFSERLVGREWSWLIAPDQEPAAMGDFFNDLRRNFVRGEAPDPVAGELVGAAFDYRRDYVHEAPCAVPAGPADWTGYHRYYAQRLVRARLPGAAAGINRGMRLLEQLQRMKRHGLVLRLESRVPLDWKIRLKHWLQQLDG